MATIPPTRVGRDLQLAPGNWAVYTWGPLTTTNTAGEAITVGDYADRSIQFTGPFGGATAVLEGSNDGTNYLTLKDPQGNDLSFTSADGGDVSTVMWWTRVSITGGDGTTAITANLFIRGNV